MESLRHWFIPHHTNNHRARILHPSGLLLLFVLLSAVYLLTDWISLYRPDILGFATNIQIEDIYQLTNEERQRRGLSHLNLDPDLTSAAYNKAEHMFKANYWSHSAPDGTTPWDFFRQVGYQYLHAGENLAKEFAFSDSVVAAWMASPTHRANILRQDYQDIGIAVVNGKLLGQETTLVVQLFGTRQPTSIAFKPQSQLATINNQLPAQAVSDEQPLYIAGFTRQPAVNLFNLVKTLSIIFGFIFMAVFTIDGLLLWRRGTVRLSGRNLAHIIFIASLIGAVWFTGIGAIL